MEEIWKPVMGYLGLYEISSEGRVKCLKNNRIRNQSLMSNGYMSVSLGKSKKWKTRLVHQLVAESFLNHKRENRKIVVDHKDNNRLNNSVSNLQVITSRLNSSKDKMNKTSRFTGVCYESSRKKWRAVVQINGKEEFLGRFNCELKAAFVYQQKIKSIKGLLF